MSRAAATSSGAQVGGLGADHAAGDGEGRGGDLVDGEGDQGLQGDPSLRIWYVRAYLTLTRAMVGMGVLAGLRPGQGGEHAAGLVGREAGEVEAHLAPAAPSPSRLYPEP